MEQKLQSGVGGGGALVIHHWIPSQAQNVGQQALNILKVNYGC